MQIYDVDDLIVTCCGTMLQPVIDDHRPASAPVKLKPDAHGEIKLK